MEHQGLQLLDRALELARQEMACVQSEEYEDAIEISRERGKITTQAWDYLDADVRDAYREKLTELNDLHKRLTKAVTEAHHLVESSLRASKNEQRRIHGYHMAVTHALQ